MKTLFQPSKIGKIELKNRFIRSAVWMKGTTPDSRLNEFMMSTYKDLARGGSGLIITGYAHISEDEQPNPNMIGIYDDTFIEELREFTQMIHSNGSKVALQIAYGGSQSYHPDAERMNILAPSPVENRATGLSPKEASIEEIQEIVKKFGAAARRAKKAGFDAVQIHGAHGYFLSSFLTPYYNRRRDEYNGEIHNRARIIYEVYEEVRNQVGKEFPVMIKLNFDDFMDPGEGLIFEDAIEVFKKLDSMGVDAFEVSATNQSSGKDHAPARTRISSPDKQSYFRKATSKIAEAVENPVILMGGNRSMDLMEEILNDTDIKFVSLGRPLLAEADLINKWRKDRGYTPKCVACNQCRITEPNSCILNKK